MIAAGLPVGDWQFWAVSGLALGAALWLLRGVLPVPALRRRRAAKRGRRRVSLTVEGKGVEPPRRS